MPLILTSIAPQLSIQSAAGTSASFSQSPTHTPLVLHTPVSQNIGAYSTVFDSDWTFTTAAYAVGVRSSQLSPIPTVFVPPSDSSKKDLIMITTQTLVSGSSSSLSLTGTSCWNFHSLRSGEHYYAYCRTNHVFARETCGSIRDYRKR